MEYKRFGNKIIVRIDKDEEILEQVKKLALKENIRLAAVQARFGGLDVLVNCAGMAQSDAFEDITPARFDEIMTLNCRTPFFLCQKALPLLRRLSGALQGAEPFLRTVLCLEVFRERGLLQCCRLGDSISLHLTSQGKKVALDRSEYLLRLHQALDASKGGAR